MAWAAELFLPVWMGVGLPLLTYLLKDDPEGARRLTFGRALARAAYWGAAWSLGAAIIEYLANEPWSWEIALKGATVCLTSLATILLLRQRARSRP